MIDRDQRRALAATFSAARRQAQHRAALRLNSWQSLQKVMDTAGIRIKLIDWPIFPLTAARNATVPRAEDPMEAWQHAADAFQYAALMGTAGYAVMYDLAAPSPYKHELDDLAREYYDRTEAYDRTVCTGPSPHGSILPANSHEAGLINRNADSIRRELTGRAERIGYSAAELKRAMDNRIKRSRY